MAVIINQGVGGEVVKKEKIPLDPAKSLVGAKSRRVPWTEVAKSVRDGSQEVMRTQRGGGVRRFQQESAVSTGYSVGILKRFVARLEFLDELSGKHRPSPEIANVSFTALELIERIHRHDVSKGHQLLQKLKEGKVVVSQLRSILKELGSHPVTADREQATSLPILTSHARFYTSEARSYAASERNWRKDAAFDGIRKLLPKLSGEVALFARPEGTSPPAIRCDAIAWRDREFTQGDGFEIAYAAHGTSRAALSDLISRAIVASTFFRKHFLVFTQDSSRELVARVLDALKLLQANSIGVVMLGAEGDPVLRRPKGPPVPDRRDMLAAICPRNRWA